MSNIEWTDVTWNPVIGCRHVAEGCRHCYAETMSKRLAAMGQKDYASILDAKGKFNGKAIARPATLAEPLSWKKPRMVFVNSMSDLFHEDVPFEFIAAVFGVMAACPQHTFQVLTKRPERALEFFEWAQHCGNMGHRHNINEAVRTFVPGASDRAVYPTQRHGMVSDPGWPLENVWLGVSIATQADADKNIPVLLKCTASVRFVSAEPLIEAVSLQRFMFEDCPSECVSKSHERAGHRVPNGALDWVIVGGESGPGARPCDLEWVRSIVQQCEAAGVSCFVKQMGTKWAIAQPGWGTARCDDRKGGKPDRWPEDLRVRQFPEVAHA